MLYYQFAFQNVSLSTHVNFDSVVLSDFDLSARLFALIRGLAFIFARVLVRAPISWPGSQHTDIGHHSVCTPCSRAHFGRVTTACVSSPKRLGLSPLARTCSRTWIFQRRLHIWALRSLRLNTTHLRKPPSKKLAIISPETWMSLVNVPMRVFRPAGRHLYRITHTCTTAAAVVQNKICEQEALLLQSQK